MKFKVFIILILFLVLVGIILKVKSNYNKERQAAIEAAQNKKAEEQKITIIEGWTLSNIADYLEKQGIVSAKDFLSYAQQYTSDKYSIFAEKPKNASLEGFLFPDTYRIIKRSGNEKQSTTTSEEIISKMIVTMNTKFTQQMRTDARAKGMSPFQILTLASIIERETGRNVTSTEGAQKLLEERKIIAGIFYNRLNADMALASDATVNYITKKNTPSASLSDLEIDSPYNTYKYKGLPPGPIANPSESSIIAAVYPTASDYYFFLHTQPEGKAIYSKTFEEHVANKNKYLK